MKILIIEDEHLAAKDLANLLKKTKHGAEIIDVISSVERGRDWFQKNPLPDLILSDVQLSDGTSFEIYESLDVKCPIIFTTAYDDYAIRAFKLNSIDYLLKPVDVKELSAALDKYETLNAETVLSDQLKLLMANWKSNTEKKYKERFLTLHRNALIPINVNDIAFFHKEELIYLITLSNEKLLIEHQTMDEIEQLVNPEIFFRVNRQFIVHIQSVSRIRTTHKGLTLHLKPPFNNEIDISREKATAFKQWVS
ncbi:MAG TPA: LytTR family DNA-binding domain-containing protein [Chryseosolibacter sp.]|nr:LytTR family DNA-binding domain-containing protein [Chryseosolibacter sp.]